MLSSFSVLAGAMSLLTLASQAAGAEGDAFNLYAYGTDIGGMPVAEWEGAPYIVETSKLTNSSITPEVVTFTVAADGTWLASTNSSTSNSTFFVPGPNANTTEAGFINGTATNATDSNNIWSGFYFYGHVAVLVDDSGSFQTLFYALPTGTDGLWSLLWNTTDSSAIPVTLKDTAPSSSSERALEKKRGLSSIALGKRGRVL